MALTSELIKKIVAWVMIIGSVICGAFIYSRMTAGTMLFNLAALLILAGLLLFMLGSGVAYLRNPGSSTRETCLSIALILQTIHFSILGVSYAGYFGPYLSCDLYIEPSIELNFEFIPIGFQFVVGYLSGDNKLLVGVNLVPVLVLVLIGYLEKKEKKQRDQDTFLPSP